MKLFLSILLISYSSLAFSQKKVRGTISDSTGAPVPFIAIGLLSLPDSSLVKGSMTDEAGRYSMEQVSTGKYILVISAVGYKEKIVEDVVVDSISKKELIVDVKLSSSSHTFGEVSVSAIKRVIEFKNGNITVNVEDSPLAQGNTVFDLLSKLPGVSVNNNQIMILGKAGVIVMIDERPQTLSGEGLINLLKSMSADLVKSIEVLKNPPVKYDAAGTSGMINIISKKTTVSGLTGTVFSSYSQGFYEQLMAGASLNYKSKKMIFYSNLSGDYCHYRRLDSFKRKFTSDTAITYLSNDMAMKIRERDLNYKAGMDWLLTKTDVLGIKIEGDPDVVEGQRDGMNTISGDNTLGFDHLVSSGYIPGVWNTTNADLNYDHKIDTLGSSFTMVADYNNLRHDLSGVNSNYFYDANEMEVLPYNNYRSGNKTRGNVFSGRADWRNIVDSVFSIESGLKAVSSEVFNDYFFERDVANGGVYTRDTNLSNKFSYKETTYAGYFNYIRSIRKLSMNLGVRLEKTFLTGSNTDKNFRLHKEYFNVFPNFSFDYKRNNQHDFQLNLTRRIDRPYFNSLNPFMIFRDQYTYEQGNPFLLPDYDNRAELSYNYAGIFSTSIAYSYIENNIMGYTSQNDVTKVTVETEGNLKSSSRLEYSIFYQKSLTKKWDISVNGNLAEMNYKGELGGMKVHENGITYFGNLTTTFLISKKAKLEISARYLGPNVFAIVHVKYNWMSSLALKLPLCKEKLDLTIGLDDVFHSFIWKSGANFENQNWSYKQINDTRRFRIALNYKFGKMKIEERNVNTSNEEEKERFGH